MDIGHDEPSSTAKLIWLIGTPIIFVVGMVGNGITLAVFLNPKTTKSSSTSVFFIWLAFADAMVLLVELPRWWIIYIYKYNIRHYSALVCKLHTLGLYCLTAVSSYVLLALTVERLIGIIRPHRMKVICTPRSVHVVCASTIVLAALLAGPVIYGKGLVIRPSVSSIYNETLSNGNMSECGQVIGIGCNITVVNSSTAVRNEFDPNRLGKAVCTWYPDEKYTLARELDQLIQFVFAFLFVETAMVVSDIIIIYKLTSIGANRSSNKQSGHIRQITITLVSVNVVFLVCRTPMFVFLSFIKPRLTDTSPQTMEVYWAIVCIFFFSNHAVNFFLYVLIGQRFRKQVSNMLCGWKKPDVTLSMTLSSVVTKPSISTDTLNSVPQ